MFSLIALYFAYRRDVVTAERYIAGLNLAEAPVVDSVAPIDADEPLPPAVLAGGIRSRQPRLENLDGVRVRTPGLGIARYITTDRALSVFFPRE